MDVPTPTAIAPPKCTTAVPDKYGFVPPDACNAHYGFYPSWEWNLVFAIAFGLTMLAHLVQMMVFKKWFCWVIVMGSLWESTCFVLRTLGAHDQQNADYVVASTLLFLLAPLWINAFAYMTVSRLVYFLLPERRIPCAPAHWLAKFFVAADVVSFLVQAAGGGMLASDDNLAAVATGQKVYMAGIGIQLLFVVVFVAVTFALARRVEVMTQGGVMKRDKAGVRPLIWCIFAVLFLIVVRIIFRFIEFSGGVSSSNPILSHEAYQLCLDALPMFIALVILNIVHPGLVLKGAESSYPSRWKRLRHRKTDSGSPIEPLSSLEYEMGRRVGSDV